MAPVSTRGLKKHKSLFVPDLTSQILRYICRKYRLRYQSPKKKLLDHGIIGEQGPWSGWHEMPLWATVGVYLFFDVRQHPGLSNICGSMLSLRLSQTTQIWAWTFSMNLSCFVFAVVRSRCRYRNILSYSGCCSWVIIPLRKRIREDEVPDRVKHHSTSPVLDGYDFRQWNRKTIGPASARRRSRYRQLDMKMS